MSKMMPLAVNQTTFVHSQHEPHMHRLQNELQRKLLSLMTLMITVDVFVIPIG